MKSVCFYVFYKGLSFNRQTIFDSLSNTLIYSGDVEEVYPDRHAGLFHLVDSFHIATAIISSTAKAAAAATTTTTTISTVSILGDMEDLYEPLNESMSMNNSTSTVPIIDNIYHHQYVTQRNYIDEVPYQTTVEWFYKHFKYIGVHGLLIGAIISIGLLAFLLFLIICLHCKTRHAKKKLADQYKQVNGNKSYLPVKHYHNIPSNINQKSKSRLPKFLRFFRSNQSKPISFRLTSNGSVSRLNSGDSYHLISSIQENHKEHKIPSQRKADFIGTENCCVHPTISPSSPTIYHQVNHFMLSGGEIPLPLSNLTAQRHSTAFTSTLRSVKKDIDNSSAQTYSAVYSCELAANLDHDQDLFSQFRSSIKRKSVVKPTNSILMTNQISYLYTKNLVDCYALQSNNSSLTLLATADENRIQLLHVRVSYS